MEATVPLENALPATVEPPREWRTLPPGAPSIAGTRIAANALFPTKAEEMPTHSTTTLTLPLMLDSGKSTLSTGVNAAEEVLPVIQTPTSTVPSRYMDGEVTHGSSGRPTQLVAVDFYSSQSL